MIALSVLFIVETSSEGCLNVSPTSSLFEAKVLGRSQRVASKRESCLMTTWNGFEKRLVRIEAKVNVLFRN